MNTLSKIAVLTAILSASASIAVADTITLGSFATGTTAASLGYSSSQTAMNFAGYTATASAPMNPTTPPLMNGTAPTYGLSANGVWAPPLGNSTWIGSTANSGPGGTMNLGYGYYQFTTNFTSAVGGPYVGSISVMGDDTVEVLLNGTVIVPFGTLGSDAHCADGTSDCLYVDTVSLSSLSLLPGTDSNQLTFIVDQAGVVNSPSDPTGMDFAASFSTVPEPGSLFLLGTGLVGGAGLLFRRRRSIRNG